ncbi:MAG: C39 family peptidase [Candidatus Peribacteraceae bacterium]|nr:C39 family peptidase [Candidatus Peribacteraceae bacterium]
MTAYRLYLQSALFPRESMHLQKFMIGCVLILDASLFSACAAKPEVLLDVPFSPQSPDGTWDPLHEEACEEMSLIMVRHFLEGTPLTRLDAEEEVQAMVAWETENGYGVDVSVAQVADIAAALYGYRARVLTDVTADTLRSELSRGNAIILPVAGRELRNPFFEGEGPFYHMLVVIGYTEEGFITHEPGTVRGERYVYPEEVLMNALHDWTGAKEQIATGQKKALILRRES